VLSSDLGSAVVSTGVEEEDDDGVEPPPGVVARWQAGEAEVDEGVGGCVHSSFLRAGVEGASEPDWE